MAGHALKAGDRVEVIDAEGCEEWYSAGSTGTVREQCQSGCWIDFDPPHGKLRSNGGRDWFAGWDRLRLLTPNDNAQKVDPMPTNNAKGLEALAERVEGLCTEWGDMDEREKRDAIAADLRSHGAAIREVVEAQKALDAARQELATTDPATEDSDTMDSMYAHRTRCLQRREAACAALRQVEGT